jgi:hypothetical protein
VGVLTKTGKVSMGNVGALTKTDNAQWVCLMREKREKNKTTQIYKTRLSEDKNGFEKLP